MQAKCPGWRAALLFVVLFVGVWSGSAFGNVDKHASPAFSPLPYPQALRPQVEFWTKIFATYSEYQVVVHDAVYLDKVYAVLDFRPLLKKHSEAKVRKLKAKRTKQELRKIRAALRKLHKHGAKGRTLSSRERKIRTLFKDVKERHKFRKAAAKGRLRAQSGIRERFHQSLRLSGRYLPRMEKIFRQKGLPVVLTRLPLIESSFNIEAYSKVGAAGIWQFMPATGRLFLTINHVVDERLDPIIATRAAADLLKSNYDRLQTWPLAVTAYNHGPSGMARAVRKVGTRDIVPIIRRYKSRTFGFASRNFYAELLAAIEVEKNSAKYFGPIKRDPLLRYDEVDLQHFVSLEIWPELPTPVPSDWWRLTRPLDHWFGTANSTSRAVAVCVSRPVRGKTSTGVTPRSALGPRLTNRLLPLLFIRSGAGRRWAVLRSATGRALELCNA